MNPSLARKACAILMLTLGVAALVVPDWSKPLECKQVGNRMVC